MSIDVGARLRFVRARHGLSQRTLAKRAGVTNSAISLIEANRVNPSVGQASVYETIALAKKAPMESILRMAITTLSDGCRRRTLGRFGRSLMAPA